MIPQNNWFKKKKLAQEILSELKSDDEEMTAVNTKIKGWRYLYVNWRESRWKWNNKWNKNYNFLNWERLNLQLFGVGGVGIWPTRKKIMKLVGFTCGLVMWE